jgi:CelD/BcsL family acetyltransferase involved in cellulose biosynthesis
MIELVEDFGDAAAWDSYVEGHPQGRFSQLFGYRCLERVYGYRPHYLGFVRSGKLVGVLPAFEARSAIFGRRFLSQPFSEYGGFLLDADLDTGARDQVFDAVLSFMRLHRHEQLETHGNFGCGPSPRFRRGNEQQLAYLPLTAGVSEVWEKVISRHVRKAVRKSEREGLTCIERSDEQTLRDHFHPLYVRSMKRLGSPPHAFAYFGQCRAALGERMRIFWAMRGEQPIAGLLGFTCGRRVSITNIVSDERYWELRPNDLVHWEFIRWAMENGYAQFDFGSVRYDGQAQYKSKWGCAMVESGYYYLATTAVAAGQRAFDSSSRTLTFAGRMWTNWVPAPVAQAVGPLLRKHLVR